jgi:hypothetical protein
VQLDEKDHLPGWGIVIDQGSGRKDAHDQEKREPVEATHHGIKDLCFKACDGFIAAQWRAAWPAYSSGYFLHVPLNSSVLRRRLGALAAYSARGRRNRKYGGNKNEIRAGGELSRKAAPAIFHASTLYAEIHD